jgi:uncharacterized protein YceK
MYMKTRYFFALVMLACCSGCGTYGGYILNPKGPYTGLTMDCKAVAAGHPQWLIDLPFTAVCDTLILPVDISNMVSSDPAPDQ